MKSHQKSIHYRTVSLCYETDNSHDISEDNHTIVEATTR